MAFTISTLSVSSVSVTTELGDFLSFAALLRRELELCIGQGWWWEGVTDLEAAELFTSTLWEGMGAIRLWGQVTHPRSTVA